VQRSCALCGNAFEAKRPHAKYCGARCRVGASRGGLSTPRTPAVARSESGGLVDAVRAALEAADRVNTVKGQHALELAGRIVNAPGMNTGVAALSKRLDDVLAEALRDSAKVANPLDELRARRDRKRRAG